MARKSSNIQNEEYKAKIAIIEFLAEFTHEYRVNEINAEIDKYNSTLAEGETPKEYVNFATTGVSLPDDFISLVSVVRAKDGYHLSPIPAVEKVHWNGYKIFANKLYCGVDVDLLYRAKIADVKFSDIQNGGTIDLPDIFLDSVVKITCMANKYDSKRR